MNPKKPATKTETKIRSEFLAMKPERRAEMADSLEGSYKSKLDASYKQKRLGEAQIKNKVKKGSMVYRGDILPVGKERLKIAKRLKMEATKDSLQSSILKKLNKIKQ